LKIPLSGGPHAAWVRSANRPSGIIDGTDRQPGDHATATPQDGTFKELGSRRHFLEYAIDRAASPEQVVRALRAAGGYCFAPPQAATGRVLS